MDLQQPGTINRTYIGTKLIQAWEMTRGAYNAYRGWDMPENEAVSDEGYLVEYLDGGKPCDPRHAGYISWSPKEQFDAAYRQVDAMTFGLAIEAMKRGERVARAGWNGAGQWVVLGQGRRVMPDELWNEHTSAFAHRKANATPAGGDVTTLVRPYMILKTAQDDIMMGWVPSGSDVLAEDWQIVASIQQE